MLLASHQLEATTSNGGILQVRGRQRVVEIFGERGIGVRKVCLGCRCLDRSRGRVLKGPEGDFA